MRSGVAPAAYLPLVFAVAGLVLACEGRVYPAADEVEPLAVGSRVPAVHLRDVAGEEVDLRELLRGRGALLVFYRGGW